jgi:hypothetical protein
MFQTKVVEKIETHTLCPITIFWGKKVPNKRQFGKILYSQTGHTGQYGACALEAGYLRLQTHSQNM